MRDFTYDMYLELLNTAKSKGIYTVRDYLLKDPREAVILRHDVDVDPAKALFMARFENEQDVKSTYYFRYPKTFDESAIQEVQRLGHEVGYHYEVLDESKGDVEDAMDLFKENLRKFRDVADVKTVSMHGSVLTKHDNRRIWETKLPRDYGLVGEAYISIDYKKVHYFSDTGRNWSGKYSIKDSVETPSPHAEHTKTTQDLIELIRKLEPKIIYINTHPKRWSQSKIQWAKELTTQSIKNIGKMFIKGT